MVNHAACLKRLSGSEGQLTLLPWREFPMPGEIGFRIGVTILGTIPVVLVIAAVLEVNRPLRRRNRLPIYFRQQWTKIDLARW